MSTVNINNIDNTNPTITNIEIIDEGFNSYDIKIDAYDNGCGIGGYSIDGLNYYQENTLKNIKDDIKIVYVKDKCNNITSQEFTLEANNNYTTIIIILIVIVVIAIIIMLISMNKK